jgi:hypothetical protein
MVARERMLMVDSHKDYFVFRTTGYEHVELLVIKTVSLVVLNANSSIQNRHL